MSSSTPTSEVKKQEFIREVSGTIVYEDIRRREIPIKLGGTDYILKEGSAGAIKAYRNALLARTSFDEKGKVSRFSGIADGVPVLVSHCLFRVIPPNGLHAVTLAEVEELPNFIIQDLFNRAKSMTRGLDEEESKDKAKRDEESAKKLPNGTLESSD